MVGGGAIDFFSQRGIKWWKSSRSGDDSKVDGPTRNMASSQVACVNFLLPLVSIPGALLTALRTLDDDVCDVLDITNGGHTSPVEFEWIGLGHSLEGGGTRGDQNTSIDGFLVAETKSGRRRAYLLEWKYAERYRAPFSSFNPFTVPNLCDFLYEPFYQIMRQRLLADRMVQKRELGIDEAKVVVVVPEQNWAYRTVSDGKATTSPPLAKLGYPRLTNEVQHLVRVLPWESVMDMSPLKSGVRLPVYKPRVVRSGRSLQVWIARHRQLLGS